MLTPSRLQRLDNFNPFGKISAVSLTRTVPQGQDAGVLLLGSACGDLRNILYTAYVEVGLPPRKLDITCAGQTASETARNVLLLAFLLDEEETAVDELWNIFFHLYLDPAGIRLVRAQVSRLLTAAESPKTWRESKYGGLIRFCDCVTFDSVRFVWTRYDGLAADVDNPDLIQTFKANLGLDKTRVAKENGAKDDYTIPAFFRCALRCAEAGMIPRNELVELHQQFWNHGTVGTVSNGPAHPNPLIAAALSDHVQLSPEAFPMSGFHLPTLFAPLTELSPLRLESISDDDVTAVSAAKTQFAAWIEAFRRLRPGFVLRFAACDPLAFCHTLQHCLASGETDANWFYNQFDTRGLDLDHDEYAVDGPAPKMFDVVESLDLANDLDTANIIGSTLPLLKDAQWATISTELELPAGKPFRPRTEGLLETPLMPLYGHIPTICLLLSAIPVEYWTCASTGALMRRVCLDPGAQVGLSMVGGQSMRLSWKHERYFSGRALCGRVNLNAEDLAALLFDLYIKALAPQQSASYWGANHRYGKGNYTLKPKLRPMHCGSAVALIKMIMTRTDPDRKTVCESLERLIGSVPGELGDVYHRLSRVATGMELHMQGLFTPEWINQVPERATLGGVFAWKPVPKVVAITVLVPRKRLEQWAVAEPSAASRRTSTVFAKVGSPGSQDYRFEDIHLMFGTIRTFGNQDSPDFQVEVEDGSLDVTRPLVAAFYVPAYVLCRGPQPSMIRVLIDSGAGNGSGDNGEYPLGAWAIDDRAHVYVSQYLPGRTGYARISDARPLAEAETANSAAATQGFTANIVKKDAETQYAAEFRTITGRADILADIGKKLLEDKAPVQLKQLSPFTISIILGKNKFAVPLTFPVPVDAAKAKTKIARTSKYIEVAVPFAEPTVSEALVDFVFPTVVSASGPPATLGATHLNLDRLPILDLTDKHRIRWLTTLAGLQFSDAERLRREESRTTATGMTASARLNFKETVFTMFMLASGLQGGQTGLFALNHQKQDGIHVLLFVSAVRLDDGGAPSPVLDAAAVALTEEMVADEEVRDFLLLLRTLECCSINVDEDELVLWKRALPALAERCRSWTHDEGSCEYRRPGATAPLSTEHGGPVTCSCGKGKLPADFMSLPGWDAIAAHAVRVAISPAYAVPIVEKISPTDRDDGAAGSGAGGQGTGVRGEGQTAVSDSGPGGVPDACRSCGARAGRAGPGAPLRRCARCLAVKYCGVECQRRDWRAHRAECAQAVEEREARALGQGG